MILQTAPPTPEGAINGPALPADAGPTGVVAATEGSLGGVETGAAAAAADEAVAASSGTVRGRLRSWTDFRVPPCRAEALAAAVATVNERDAQAAAAAVFGGGASEEEEPQQQVAGSFGLDSGVGGYLWCG